MALYKLIVVLTNWYQLLQSKVQLFNEYSLVSCFNPKVFDICKCEAILVAVDKNLQVETSCN